MYKGIPDRWRSAAWQALVERYANSVSGLPARRASAASGAVMRMKDEVDILSGRYNVGFSGVPVGSAGGGVRRVADRICFRLDRN